MAGQKREARPRTTSPGHPRLSLSLSKTWMPGTGPDMTGRTQKAGSDPGLFYLHAVAVRYAVIVREGGRSSTPRLRGSIAEAGGYWMPAFAGMTS